MEICFHSADEYDEVVFLLEIPRPYLRTKSITGIVFLVSQLAPWFSAIIVSEATTQVDYP